MFVYTVYTKHWWQKTLVDFAVHGQSIKDLAIHQQFLLYLISFLQPLLQNVVSINKNEFLDCLGSVFALTAELASTLLKATI